MSKNCLWQMDVKDSSCFHTEHVLKTIREQKSVNIWVRDSALIKRVKMPGQPPFLGDDFLSTHIDSQSRRMLCREHLRDLVHFTSLKLPRTQVWGCRYQIRNWKLAVYGPSRKVIFCLACRYLFLIKPIVKNQMIYYKKRNETSTHIL